MNQTLAIQPTTCSNTGWVVPPPLIIVGYFNWMSSSAVVASNNQNFNYAELMSALVMHRCMKVIQIKTTVIL
jgi:hypothetical protein